MTQQVDHIKQAEYALGSYRNVPREFAGKSKGLEEAKVEALIAIAQQQQIANLIAVTDCSANDPAIVKLIGLETE
jgi:hypothetical protein